MKKVAIYARVSREDQTIQNQVRICKKYCDVNNYKVHKTYSDTKSGLSINRPAFNELLNDMRHYKFDIIMVTKLDRVGRSLQHLLSLFDEFKKKGIKFISVTQNIDTTSASGILNMQILGAFAEYERNLISERTRAGIEKSKRVGKRGKDKKKRKRRKVLRKSESVILPTIYDNK